MTLLAGQVERRGTILSLGVDNSVGTSHRKVNKETHGDQISIMEVVCRSLSFLHQ